MKLAARTAVVQKAQNAICGAFFRELEKHDLTYLEAIACAAEITQTLLKYGLRAERQPKQPNRGAHRV